jgi:hypothetical protein
MVNKLTDIPVNEGDKPGHEGLPKGEKIPLIPSASTTEYIILRRGDQGQEVARSAYTARF